jgi:hypothetical protein
MPFPAENLHQLELLASDKDSEQLERFLAFHRAHPEIYRIFETKALELIKAGHHHYSARTILEVTRWHVDIRNREQDYKINNNWIPFYSRMFAATYPEHSGFFRQRSRQKVVSE